MAQLLEIGQFTLVQHKDRLRCDVATSIAVEPSASYPQQTNDKHLELLRAGKIWVRQGQKLRLLIETSVDGLSLNADIIHDELQESICKAKLWQHLGIAVSVNHPSSTSSNPAVSTIEFDLQQANGRDQHEGKLRHALSKNIPYEDVQPPAGVRQMRLKLVKISLSIECQQSSSRVQVAKCKSSTEENSQFPNNPSLLDKIIDLNTVKYFVDGALRSTMRAKPGPLDGKIKLLNDMSVSKLEDIAPVIWKPGYLANIAQRAYFLPTICFALTSTNFEAVASPSLKSKLLRLSGFGEVNTQSSWTGDYNQPPCSKGYDTVMCRLWSILERSLRGYPDPHISKSKKEVCRVSEDALPTAKNNSGDTEAPKSQEGIQNVSKLGNTVVKVCQDHNFCNTNVFQDEIYTMNEFMPVTIVKSESAQSTQVEIRNDYFEEGSEISELQHDIPDYYDNCKSGLSLRPNPRRDVKHSGQGKEIGFAMDDEAVRWYEDVGTKIEVKNKSLGIASNKHSATYFDQSVVIDDSQELPSSKSSDNIYWDDTFKFEEGSGIAAYDMLNVTPDRSGNPDYNDERVLASFHHAVESDNSQDEGSTLGKIIVCGTVKKEIQPLQTDFYVNEYMEDVFLLDKRYEEFQNTHEYAMGVENCDDLINDMDDHMDNPLEDSEYNEGNCGQLSSNSLKVHPIVFGLECHRPGYTMQPQSSQDALFAQIRKRATIASETSSEFLGFSTFGHEDYLGSESAEYT